MKLLKMMVCGVLTLTAGEIPLTRIKTKTDCLIFRLDVASLFGDSLPICVYLSSLCLSLNLSLVLSSITVYLSFIFSANLRVSLSLFCVYLSQSLVFSGPIFSAYLYTLVPSSISVYLSSTILVYVPPKLVPFFYHLSRSGSLSVSVLCLSVSISFLWFHHLTLSIFLSSLQISSSIPLFSGLLCICSVPQTYFTSIYAGVNFSFFWIFNSP